jgi:ATP-binding cassette subfamily F protein 3
MIILQAQKINKSFADQDVLQDISLTIQDKERVGLVGVNGAGKSTLLKCLTGLMAVDSGELSFSSNLSIGYLEQLAEYADGTSIWDAMLESFAGILEKRRRLHELEADMARGGPDLEKIMERYASLSEAYELANGYACENTARRILSGLGFKQEDYTREAQSLSGGQKTRLNLGRLLALAPDLLCLDEPTNHLDMASVEWLEEFIKNYSGTMLVVSHDRRFLDRTATRILDLRLGQMSSYDGNYSQYLIKKAAADLVWQRAYEKQQEYISQTEAYILRFKAGIKSKQARGRQSQLQRLDRIDAPQQGKSLSQRSLKMNQKSGQDVLTLRGVSKSFGSLQLFNNLDLSISKGEKIALIGPNGCGKTTLLKIITDRLMADEGEMRLGSRVVLGYFGQEYEDLDAQNTVLDEILAASQLTLEEARTALGTMLFSGDDVFKRVGDLSGGEMGRLAFLKLLLSGANFLILDEPTNHLDIESCQMVEKMLQDYEGTILLVSHDRYFIDQIVNRLLCFSEGKLESYCGNYSYYQEKLQAQQKLDTFTQRETRQDRLRPEIMAREQEKERQKIHRKRIRDLETIENRIMDLESQKTQLEIQLSDPLTYSDEGKARASTTSYKNIEELLASAYRDWEILNQKLEEEQIEGCSDEISVH